MNLRRIENVCKNSRYFSSHGKHSFIDFSENMRMVIPTKQDLEYQLPTKKIQFIHRFHLWLDGKANLVNKITTSRNDRVNKHAAYFWLGKLAYFNHFPLMSIFSKFIGNVSKIDHFLESTPQINDSSILIYRNMNPQKYIRHHFFDYFYFVSLYCMLFTHMTTFFLPLLIMSGLIPRHYLNTKMIVLRMDLIPSSEELVVTKASFFGGVKTSRIKITNLNKVDFDNTLGTFNFSKICIHL